MILVTGHGDQLSEPDDKIIKRVVLKTFKKKQDNFVIIEEQEGNFIQARPMGESIDESGCRFEYRDSIIGKHFAANNVPVETVIAVFQQFNRGDQAFRKAIRWRNISSQFDWPSPEKQESEEVKEIATTLNSVYAEYEMKKRRG